MVTTKSQRLEEHKPSLVLCNKRTSLLTLKIYQLTHTHQPLSLNQLPHKMLFPKANAQSWAYLKRPAISLTWVVSQIHFTELYLTLSKEEMSKKSSEWSVSQISTWLASKMSPKISVSHRFSLLASFQTPRLPSRWSQCWSSWEWTPAEKIHLSRLLSSTLREKPITRSFSTSAMSVAISLTTKISMVRPQSTTPFVRATSRRLSYSLKWGHYSTMLTRRHRDRFITRSSKTTLKWSNSLLIKEPTYRHQIKKDWRRHYGQKN